MSLPALALRIATVKLLRDATVAGSNVLDAPHDPVGRAQAISGAVIAVYTSDQVLTPTRKTSILSNATRTVELRLQVLLPPEVQIPSGDRLITIDVREEGGATLLDVIYRQIERALCAVGQPWRELWHEVVGKIEKVTVEDLIIPVERAVDLVAREIAFVCQTMDSPAIGSTENPTWQRLVTLMRADLDLTTIADWIEAEITLPGNLVPWQVATTLAGLGRSEADALGIGALPGGEAEPLAEAFRIVVPGRPDLIITEGSDP